MFLRVVGGMSVNQPNPKSIESFFALERWTPVMIQGRHAYDITLDSQRLSMGQWDELEKRINAGEDDGLVDLALAVGLRWNLTRDGVEIPIETREQLEGEAVVFIGAALFATFQRVHEELFPLKRPATNSTATSTPADSTAQ